MPGELQPLSSNLRIATEDGTPTEYFIRWAQERQIDIGEGISQAQAEILINDFAASREITAGAGLTGGGTLAADRTINVGAGVGIAVTVDAVRLTDTAVTPSTYGSATMSAVITVDQQGRITGISEVPITGGGGGGTPPTLRGSAVFYVNNVISINVTLTTGSVAGDFVVICANNGWSVLTPTGATSLSNLTGSNTNGAAVFKALTTTDITNGFILVDFVNVYYGAVSISTFVAATVTSITLADAIRTSGPSSPQALVTPVVFANATLVLYGGARGNGAVTITPGTPGGSTTNFEGSAALNHFTPASAGVVNASFAFVDSSGGQYCAGVIVTGLP